MFFEYCLVKFGLVVLSTSNFFRFFQPTPSGHAATWAAAWSLAVSRCFSIMAFSARRRSRYCSVRIVAVNSPGRKASFVLRGVRGGLMHQSFAYKKEEATILASRGLLQKNSSDFSSSIRVISPSEKGKQSLTPEYLSLCTPGSVMLHSFIVRNDTYVRSPTLVR